jgi:glycosyl transferase family 25
LIPIYYINVAAQTARRRFMERQCAALGLVAARFEAVTQPSAEDVRRYCNPYTRRPLLLPELACSLSHWSLAKRIAEGDARFGVIFEDDALLSTELPRFLAAFEVYERRLDIVKLETSTEWLRMHPSHDHEFGGIKLTRCFSISAGAGGYILSRRAAAEIVRRRHLMLSRPYDHALFHPHRILAHAGLVTRFAVPALCVQSSLVGGPLASAMGRESIERPQPAPWFRAARTFVNALERDVIDGPQRLWHQFVDKAEKQMTALAGEPVATAETQTAGPKAGGALA